MNPWKISTILLAGSLVLTAVFWAAGVPFFFLFLFIPLIPFLSRPGTGRKYCPVCGWETTGSERFCPFDAALLEDAAPEPDDKT